MSQFKLDTAAYLRRIGMEGPLEPTAENLLRLTRAHLEAVPFENLEVCLEGREPDLSPEGLYRKVVERRRGGWCFELNKLFYLLLTELGYRCRSVPARVIHLRTVIRPVTHRATLVTAGGRTWYCDVGFGGAGPKGAIAIDTDGEQTVFGDTFRVTPNTGDYTGWYPGEITISRLDGGRWEPVLCFRDTDVWQDQDFGTLSGYFAAHPHSPFKGKAVLYRCTPGGWISLVDRHLVRLDRGLRTEADLAPEQVQTVISQEFGLTLS
ncbi:MAG: arylamine N-acetyltransferase [Eubacteriales bacterium]|nr:arylamine N-acetyltransferase [Eubacteriales bacterium]